MKFRSIRYAKNEDTKEIVDAELFLPTYKDAFEKRKQHHTDQLNVSCLECTQRLTIASSKNAQIHFRHLPNSTYCILKEEDITEEEVEKLNAVFVAKESKRHKDLKNGIAARLAFVDGIDPISIRTEYRITIDGILHRPDVYCRYKEHEIVFEVQLSVLSPRYIFSRYDFYRKNGIYLIWILENFNVHDGIKQFERDIKYLNEHQNFFKLNESFTGNLSLVCDYKYCLLNENNELRTPWKQRQVLLNELTFDKESFQVYYYNFEVHKKQLENKQKEILERLEEERLKEANLNRLKVLKYRAEEAIKLIRIFFKREFLLIDEQHRLEELIQTKDERDSLNLLLDFKGENKKYISDILFDSNKTVFIQRILQTVAIELDLGIRNEFGQTLVQFYILNIRIDLLFGILCELFKAGYLLNSDDRKFLEIMKKNGDNELLEKIYFCDFLNSISDKTQCSEIHTINRYLFALASFRDNKPIAFNYKGDNALIQILHLLLTGSYLQFLEMTIRAIDRFNLSSYIIEYDKNKKLRTKLKELDKYFMEHDYKYAVEQNNAYDEIIMEVFPELL